MLERCMHSVLELLEMDAMLHCSIQSVFEVDSNGCYNVASRESWNWLPEHVESWLKWMLQRSIQSVWEIDWNGCWNVASTAFWSWLKWMLARRMHSVLELLEMDVMLHCSIQSVFEVDSNGCYNVASRASWNWLPEHVASWLKWMLQRKFQCLEVAWKRISNITRGNDSLRWKRSFRGSETIAPATQKKGSHSPVP